MGGANSSFPVRRGQDETGHPGPDRDAPASSRSLAQIVCILVDRPALVEELLALTSREERHARLVSAGVIDWAYVPKQGPPKGRAEQLVPPGHIATGDGYLLPMTPILSVASAAL